MTNGGTMMVRSSNGIESPSSLQRAAFPYVGNAALAYGTVVLLSAIGWAGLLAILVR